VFLGVQEDIKIIQEFHGKHFDFDKRIVKEWDLKGKKILYVAFGT
jgi:hypothetical protein